MKTMNDKDAVAFCNSFTHRSTSPSMKALRDRGSARENAMSERAQGKLPGLDSFNNSPDRNRGRFSYLGLHSRPVDDMPFDTFGEYC
jgi:hypothetical protein